MAENALETIVGNMKTTTVLVVGDLMLDRFVYGAVERISPESPVPVLSLKREEKMLGGAGNALANLAGLGAQGRILAVIGDDQDGRDITAKISDMGFATFLATDAARPTTVKTRFLAGHQQLLRTDFESKAPISETLYKEILSKLGDALKGVQALIISDYGKGLLRDDLLAEILKRAKAAKIPVIVDPKGMHYRG